jgi:hypothetical protein
MPPATPDTPYPLGATSAEHARLIRQAAIWDPFTERLFRDAGICPGQRVLDIGSGSATSQCSLRGLSAHRAR